MKKLYIFLIMLFLHTISLADGYFYVTPNGQPTNSGTSWDQSWGLPLTSGNWSTLNQWFNNPYTSGNLYLIFRGSP